VRGFSFFGVSFVYVIFEDGTDIYWARSRVLEYLNAASRRLPTGVTPSLGPDATGVGWVYQYVVRGSQMSLAELRTIQDWQLRFGLAKAPGVAEVASVGGFVKQYSVVIDPRRLQALGIPLSRIRDVIRDSNMDVGGRTVEVSETEFAVRGRGYVKSLSDLEQIVVKNEGGVPVLLKDVARVELTSDERRGIAEMDGEGEVVSGIALQRFGENALSVIQNVKDRLAEMAPSLPEGVTIEAVYDRSNLIHRAIDTLKRILIEESAIVALVCVIFLLHARSALVAVLTLPLGVLIAYICMWALGLSSNIMSLGGIAIAIGAMVDAAIVMIENAHKHLERAPPGKPRGEILGGRRRGRPGAVLQPAHHHRIVPADFRAGGAGGEAVQTARLHQDLRHGRRGAPVHPSGPGIDDGVRTRPHHAGAQQPREPVLDVGLPAGDPARADIQGDHDPHRTGIARREPVACVEARQ
jgi:Cu(I)/Ag(I) efflux system membrane protein CusA/SilA